ncbi:ABC transporter substrate-binding protein [Kribbella sp. NPDC026611]|uniref:ABC transporter substrate-binding protein n=1 Tax=Kribbella sp. NPDC026611 TaxID=3154911 RepID=UPI0033DF1197
MGEGWAFTDDRAAEVRSTRRPGRVVAYAQAARTLVELGVPVVGYFGSQHNADSGNAASELDAPLVGAGDSVDLDLVKSLRPDLVVTVTYGGEVYGVSAAVASDLESIAPVLAIGIAGDRTLASVINRFHELAEALGGDADDPETPLTTATEALADAVRRNPRQVTALSGGTATDAYVANPKYWPSLHLLADAGVTFTPTTTSGGWEVVKWPDLPTAHPADLALYDQRPNSMGPDQLATIPSWPEVPAVRTGNVVPWNPEPTLTFRAAATFVNTVSEHHR